MRRNGCLVWRQVSRSTTLSTKAKAVTSLSTDKDIEKKCWTSENLIKLRLRSIFEMLMPAPPTPNEVNAKYVKDILSHYQKSLIFTKRVADVPGEELLKETLADAIGAHMRNELLPAARFAYYGGYLNFADVNKLNVFYNTIETHLNTRGLGWKEPSKSPPWSNLTVTKILFKPEYMHRPCERLITKRDSNSCIHLPKPKIDDIEKPSSIVLPLRTNGFFSLTSPRSENVLLDYYSTATKCILQQSPQSCRNTDFVTFNNDLWHWMKRHVAPHLLDERLYAAYGGVLRVAAATQKYGSGHAYRDLTETEKIQLSTNEFWTKIHKPYSILLGSKFSDAFSDIYTVLIVATLICLFQALVYCIIITFKSNRSKKDGFMRKRRDGDDFSVRKDPQQENQSKSLSGSGKRISKANPQSKVLINAYHKTETVYDFNEDEEKVLAIPANDSDDSRASLKRSTSDTEESSEVKIETGRSKSPPKLDALITELRIQKPSAGNSAVFHQASLHSEDGTGSNSYTTFVQRNVNLDYSWSASESWSSDQTTSSKDSKLKHPRSRQSRNMERARRIIYKHSNRKSNSDVILKPVSKVTPSPTFVSTSNLRD
ncbi:hypothetical protein EVAR_12960_1 [Eumeta japonica]|uniref:Uncharacterized protein n=1 Tax=Eumeta variegata TaxID=151549 RepID=A0A4C1TWU4_EUMVA|nr:hypothetical protein EVAR_12960_1 [Eumeta japonica]